MKGIFWNCNGFRVPKKHRFIADMTKDFDLNFIALSEMVKKEFSVTFLKKFMCGEGFHGHRYLGFRYRSYR
jgi:hypothetical protein